MIDSSDTDIAQAEPSASAPFRLSDHIRQARSAEPVQNEDGSTTVYLRLNRTERYSTLPRPRRRWRVWRSGPRRIDTDNMTRSANVRKIRRRISDVT
ncbi:MAG: hypothetical protein ABFR95_05715 [Actinomycetota bacterium]